MPLPKQLRGLLMVQFHARSAGAALAMSVVRGQPQKGNVHLAFRSVSPTCNPNESAASPPLSSYQPREELFWYRITKCLQRFPSVKKLQRDPKAQRLHSWRKKPSQSCSSYLTKGKVLFFYFFFPLFFFFTGTH